VSALRKKQFRHGLLGDFKESLISATRAEQKAQSTGARHITALALMRQSTARTTLGQKEEAIVVGEKARRIFAEIGDRDSVAKLNANLAAVLVSQAKFEDAKKLHTESLQEFREIGDKRGEAIELSQLGWAAESQDNLDESHITNKRSQSSANSGIRPGSQG